MQNLINRSLFCLSICIPMLIVTLLVAGTVDYKSHLLSFFPQLNNNVTYCATELRTPAPLRVYMYDLPPRFNVQMMNPSFPDNTTVTAANIPRWGWNDGLRRQHSVEYWMMASLLYQGNDEAGLTREAIRVSDPNSADVFFVPFFSSMSVNVHVQNMAQVDTVDEKLQVHFHSSFFGTVLVFLSLLDFCIVWHLLTGKISLCSLLVNISASVACLCKRLVTMSLQ